MARGHSARAFVAGYAVALAACGPDEPLEPAELAEVCGEPSPFRVLELAEGEHALPNSVVRVGDRILWLVGDADFEPSVHEHGYEAPQETVAWATGPCGESPVVVAHDFDSMFVHAETWPDHALACDHETGDVFVLDPDGVRPPNLVAPAAACGRTWTEHGIFNTAPREDGTTELVFQPLAADPWDPAPPTVRLVEALRPDRWHLAWSASHDTFAVRGDELFALEADGDLVTIDLIDGSTAIERTGVWAFEITDDARWLLWQDPPATTDDSYWSPSTLSLTDRESGVTTQMAEGTVNGSVVRSWREPDHLRLRLGEYFGDPSLVVLLPSLETYLIPEGRKVLGPIEGGARWLVAATQSGSLDTTLRLRDLDDESETPLFDGDGWIEERDDGLDVLEISMWIDEQPFDHGEMWYVPFDGEPELRARRASMHRFDLGSDLLLTSLDIHGDWVGDLVVVDEETLEERLVDADVFAYSTGYNERGRFPDDAFAYVVDDGERSGIWLARLAPE